MHCKGELVPLPTLKLKLDVGNSSLILSFYNSNKSVTSAYLVCTCADSCLRRHESRVDWERVAAEPGFASVPQLLYGVASRRTYAGPPDEEGPAWPAEDGGQFPQVHRESVIF